VKKGPLSLDGIRHSHNVYLDFKIKCDKCLYDTDIVTINSKGLKYYCILCGNDLTKQIKGKKWHI